MKTREYTKISQPTVLAWSRLADIAPNHSPEGLQFEGGCPARLDTCPIEMSLLIDGRWASGQSSTDLRSRRPRLRVESELS